VLLIELFHNFILGTAPQPPFFFSTPRLISPFQAYPDLVEKAFALFLSAVGISLGKSVKLVLNRACPACPERATRVEGSEVEGLTKWTVIFVGCALHNNFFTGSPKPGSLKPSSRLHRLFRPFHQAKLPKPVPALPSIWLRLGGDDIEPASPKAIPHSSRPPILSRHVAASERTL